MKTMEKETETAQTADSDAIVTIRGSCLCCYRLQLDWEWLFVVRICLYDLSPKSEPKLLYVLGVHIFTERYATFLCFAYVFSILGFNLLAKALSY
jgi:hypothetical protein